MGYRQVIPIRAHGSDLRRSYATWIISALCVAALVRLATLPDDTAAAIVSALGVVPARLLASPSAPSQLLTLLTSAFLHAGWVHLAGNMLFLLVFGPIVEQRLGWWRYAALYSASGLVGALTHVVVHPSSASPLVGASAAIAGVLGAHLVLSPHSKITTVIPALIYFEIAVLPAGFVIGLWFLLQIASAVAPVTELAAPVAWYAHLGGFATGGLAATVLKAAGNNKTAPRARSRVSTRNRTTR